MNAMEKSAAPLVSIVLCTYNGEQYLDRQLQSLSQQTYPTIEFICSDNNSDDNTAAILNNWCMQNSNRKYFTCYTKGLNANFYSAIGHATGQYIIFCDQDDIWLPGKVERLVTFHQQHSEASLVYCLSKEFNIDTEPEDNKIKPGNYLEGTDIRKTMLISFTLGHNICIKKEVLLSLPPSPSETVAFDWWITVSAMCKGPIRCLPEALTFWRKHGVNTTHEINKGLFYKSRIAYLQTFLQNNLIQERDKKWIREMIEQFTKLETKASSFSLAMHLLKNAPTIFFYKNKKNPIGKWISFLKWSLRMSKQQYHL